MPTGLQIGGEFKERLKKMLNNFIVLFNRKISNDTCGIRGSTA